MVSARLQFEAACQLQKFAGLAQWQCRELVPLRRVFDSLDQLQILMAGLAEWLRRWIVAPVTRVRFSHLAPIIRGFRNVALRCPRQLLALAGARVGSPFLGGSYKGIIHGLHP